ADALFQLQAEEDRIDGQVLRLVDDAAARIARLQPLRLNGLTHRPADLFGAGEDLVAALRLRHHRVVDRQRAAHDDDVHGVDLAGAAVGDVARQRQRGEGDI